MIRLNFPTMFGVASVLVASATAQQPARLELKPGEHIAILGGALGDRMQHSGWLEALIHAKYPQADLVFRNLAVAGDEVNTWHRSQDFGTRDEWLTWTQADLVFAFYGFNESFKGYEGVGEFKKNLEKFLTDLAAQNYSGKGAPRVVLFSPIAAERHQDPNFPDPAAMNTNLKNYTDAMADVAKAKGIQFVDLYSPSAQAFVDAAQKGQSLTINGLHLTDDGEAAIAPAAFQQLFGEPAPAAKPGKLRDAVAEKNWQWHQRYRTIDGYNVYGGRSREAYAPKDASGKVSEKISNSIVMQREMQQRDVLTANRDQRVWAIAKGGDLVVKDDNLPAAVPVATNKPGPNPDLSFPYLSGEEAIAKMKIHRGMKVNLFADEKQFPELVNPVQMAWDPKGRLWVAAWTNYPEREPTGKIGDQLLVLEDTNADGKADKCTAFLDDLNGPTGFQFYKDGVLVMQAPDIWFVRDTNGDGRGDTRERVLMGLDSADSHHTTNAMSLDPGGSVYLSDGVFHRTQIETANGPLRHSDGIIWRFEPRTGKVDNYMPYGFANPHGKVFDHWGDDLVTDATGNNTYFAPAASGRLDSGKHSGVKQFWDRPSRPCPGTGMLSSRHFPEEFQGNFLNCNVISFQGIYRVGISQDGSGLKGETLEHLISSDDPNFRPSQVNVGPDGALYVADWHQTIIGHLQHHLRDPNRDHQHGRIYRMTYEGRPLLTPAKIDGQPIESLLALLKEPEDDTRTRVKIELGKHDSAKVVAAIKGWIPTLDARDAAYQHHLMEALWVHQWHNVVDTDLLKQMLKSPSPQARAAATRVLCYWRDRVPEALDLLIVQAGDEDARVRLQAVRAASFFDGKEAAPALQVAFETLKHPGDYYLDYTYAETLKQLRTQPGGKDLPSDPAVLAKYVEKLSDRDLAQAPNVEPVLIARLERKSSDAAVRDTALSKLSALRKTDRTTELVAALKRLDSNNGSQTTIDELAKLLTTSAPADLTKVKPTLAMLLESANQKSVRRAAVAALITADGKPDALWIAAKDDGAKEVIAGGSSAIIDPTLRAKFQPLLAAALADTKSSAGLRAVVFKALPLMGAENAKANFTLLADALKAGEHRTIAAQAIGQLPRDSWDAGAAAPVVESILAWAKTLPDAKRSAPEIVSAMQLGQDLAGLLPAADASRLRKELRALGVSVFVLRAVHEQMRYDTPRLVVEAGKPFEIVFENPDVMPHNLVIVKPGTREKIGQAATPMKPDQLDKQGRAYIPKSDDILAATKLVEAGQSETLKMTAPKTEGDYEYVCTFPGHYMIMWGKLAVVKDVDAYLAANPTFTTTAPGVAPHVHKH